MKKVGATGSEFKCSDDRFGSDNMAKNLSFHPPWQVIGAAEKMAENTSLGTACCAFPNQSLAVTIQASDTVNWIPLISFSLLQIVTKSLPLSCRPLPDPQDLWEVLQWYLTLTKLKSRIGDNLCISSAWSLLINR